MSKILKVSLFLFLILFSSTLFTSCQKRSPANSASKVKIENVEYSSLTEAVNNAKDNDTIEIYEDLNDNKNVTITRPLSIKGVLTNNQIKPKFYGSLTIDLEGENDSVLIENIEIIHNGTNENGANNNTTIGLNLINGGLEFKKNAIALSPSSTPEPTATGLVISREANSKNIKPITIVGNAFGEYLTNNQDLNGAIIIKSNLANRFSSLNLDEEDLISENTFFTTKEGNQIISIDYSSSPEKYSFLATTSPMQLISALNYHQPSTNTTYILNPATNYSAEENEQTTINEKTTLIIKGNNATSFDNLTLLVQGYLEVENETSNLNVEKQGSTANVIVNNENASINVK